VRAGYGLLLRGLASRGRVGAIAAASGLLALLGIVAAVRGAGAAFGADLVEQAGVLLLLPVGALLFGAAALGEPAEDGTLAYLWLRPRPRWQLALAGLAAAASATLPLTVVPLLVIALITGTSPPFVGGVVVIGVIATVVYGTVFLALGVRTKRSLLWGLIYVLFWENIVGNVSDTLARTTLRGHLGSLFDRMTGQHFSSRPIAPGVAATTLVLVTALAFALAVRWTTRAELE
jgi:ABC-2 type transport system permease protein